MAHPFVKLDAIVKARQDKWTTSLYLDLSAEGNGSRIVDLMQYVGAESLFQCRLYLPPRFGADHNAALRMAIQKAARESGFQLVIIKSIVKELVTFACRRHRMYKPSSTDKSVDHSSSSTGGPYKAGTTATHLHCRTQSKASKKKNGSAVPRPEALRTVTSKPVSKGTVCPFQFTFRWDRSKEQWYMTPGRGCSLHRYHDKVPKEFMPFQTSEMTAEDVQIMQQCGRASAPSGVMQSVLLERTNTLPTATQCARLLKPSEDQYGYRAGANAHIQQLRADPNVSFIAIYHHVDESDLIAKRSKGRPIKLKVKAEVSLGAASMDRREKMMDLQVDDKYEADVASFILAQIDDNKTHANKKILLASAWTTNEERRLFELFPEFATMDTSSQSNRNGLPFAMLCGRDHNGSAFVAVRCFLPNECKWAFHWYWQKAVPTLLGKAILRNNLIITDGDDKLYGPLLALIPSVYPNTQHRLCIYHLVAQKLALLRLHNSNKVFVKYCLLKFRHILYAWMRPGGVESVDEYRVSRARMGKWLQALKSNNLMKDNVPMLEQFVVEKLDGLMERWFFPSRKGRCMDETTTSLGESCNATLKRYLGGVKPNMALATSSAKMMQQSRVAHCKRQKASVLAAGGTMLWAATESSLYVTKFAEALTREEFIASQHITSRKEVKNSLFDGCFKIYD